MAESATISLSSGYTFRLEKAAAIQLPPKGLFRFLRGNFIKSPPLADARKGFAARKDEFNHTLFFSSLVQQSFYQEQILRHMVSPQAGHHGPFKIDKLSPADYQQKPWAECVKAIDKRLRFTRFGSEQLNARSHENVMGFVRRRANLPSSRLSGLRSFELAPCRDFSAGENRRFQHEWSHSLLEFHEYHLLDMIDGHFSCLIFAFD